MELYRKLSIFGVFLTLVLIFYQSSLSYPLGDYTFSYLAVTYHFGIFLILLVFLFYSTRFKQEEVLIAIFICILYAGLDELHQYFVPGRSCNLFDFSIDSLGIFFGIVFVFLWNKIIDKYAPA